MRLLISSVLSLIPEGKKMMKNLKMIRKNLCFNIINKQNMENGKDMKNVVFVNNQTFLCYYYYYLSLLFIFLFKNYCIVCHY